MKYFKGEENELKIDLATEYYLQTFQDDLAAYFDEIYESTPLAEFLYDENRVPLTNAFKRDIFIRTFTQILESWKFCGTYESYLSFFRTLFGENVEVLFSNPGPGVLDIDVEAIDLVNYNFISREIIDNEYVYSNIVDDVGDQIVFTAILGIETEAELERVLFTLVPAGIYTTISLTIGV